METLDWKNLPFGYMKTDYNIRSVYKDGKWGKLEVSASEYMIFILLPPDCTMVRRHLRD
jgi:branched-chain amino acid aminotransferase